MKLLNFSKNILYKKSRGFSVVEAILSIAIFAMIATSIVGTIFYAQQDTRYAGVKTRATVLAEEGLEAVQSIRDEDYAQLSTPGTYGLSITANKWVLNLGQPDSTGIPNIFTRQITIENISLPDVGNSKKITSTVTWNYLSRNGTVSLVSYLTNWRQAAVTPLTTPTDLILNSVSTQQIDLSWTASTGGNPSVAGYKIERAPDVSGVAGTYAQIDTTTAPTTIYSDTTASVNTKYWYRVRAYDSSGNNSGYSTTNAYNYKKAITFNTTAAGANVATNQTDFPVAVHINSSSWPNTIERSNFFGAYNLGGKRIRFYDADETTNLSYEVEYYDSVAQEAVYWVKVPQVDGGSATDKIIVTYGNDVYSADQSNPAAVWNNSYVYVFHSHDSVSPLTSSTSTPMNLALTGTAQINGHAGKARSYNGSTDNAYNSTGSAMPSNLTLLVMTKPTSVVSDAGMTTWSNAAGNSFWGLARYSAKMRYQWGASAGNYRHYEPTSTVTSGSYDMWHVTQTGVSAPLMYQNGSSVGSSLVLSAGVDTKPPIQPFALGRFGGYNGLYYTGEIDEVRLSDNVRSADWVKLEYYSIKKTNYNGDNGAGAAKLINYGSQQNFSGSARTLANAPASPSATAASTTQINISWASGGVQDHYHVKSSSNNYVTNIYNSTAASASQSGLVAGTQYTYRIYGVNTDDDESASFASVSRYTLSDPPTLPVATDGTYVNKINVSWTASLTASSYKVYKDGVSGVGTLVYNSTGTSFDDTTTGSHTYYIYSVNADNVENPSYVSDAGSTGSAASWATPAMDTSLDVNHPGGTATTNAYDAYRIQVDGNYAYMIKNDGANVNYNDFFVLDISGATPTIAGYTRVYSGTTALTLSNLSRAVMSGSTKYVYVTTNNGSFEFARINVTTPTAPAATMYNISAGSYTVNRGIYAVAGSPPTVFVIAGSTSASTLFAINGDTGATIKSRALTAGTSQAAEEIVVVGNRGYVSSDNDTNELQTIGNADGTATAMTSTGNYNILTDASAASAANALSIEGYNSGSTNTVLLGLADGRLIKVNQNTSTNALTLGGSYNSAVTSNFNDVSINSANSLAFIATSNTAAEFRVVTISTMASYGVHNISGTTAIGRGIAYHDTKDRAYMATQGDTNELYIVKPGP